MNWRRASLGALFAVPVLALLLYGLGQDPGAVVSPLPGREAPDFRLPILPGTPTETVGAGEAAGADGLPAAGDSVSLTDLRGDVVVVNFFASWCVACREEHAVLDRAARRYRDRGVRVYGVVYQDSPENAIRWIRRMGGQSYPALVDDRSRTAIDYGVWKIPETFFIGPDGIITHKHLGPLTDAAIERELESVLGADVAQSSAAP